MRTGDCCMRGVLSAGYDIPFACLMVHVTVAVHLRPGLAPQHRAFVEDNEGQRCVQANPMTSYFL
jgi:hypothetical protein